MKLWSGNLKGREHLEDLCIGGRIITEWILDGKDSSADSCEHSNEHSGFIKGGEFLE
jgi:hypothetical protein